MKRIYITAVPLYFNFTDPVREPARDVCPANFSMVRSEALTPVHFPICAVAAETADPTDEIIVLGVRQYHDAEAVNPNLAVLREELEAHGLSGAKIIDIAMPEAQDKDTQLDVFGRLLEHLSDDAVYYADSTFGSKTFPVLLISLMNYLDKLYDNCTVGGIYYRELNHKTGTSRLFEVSSVFHLNNIVDMISAGTGSKERKREAIRLLLTGYPD